MAIGNDNHRIVCRGYGRASTDMQTLSTDQQHAKIKDAFEAYQRFKPGWSEYVWGGFFADEETSRTSSFMHRNFGSYVLAQCQPGDIVMVANYDRIFARVQDCCETMEWMQQHQIRLIILDFDIDTSTIIGDFCFKLLALVKELDVKTIRERTRNAVRHRQRLGMAHGAPSIGWQHIMVNIPGKGQKTYLIPNKKHRRLARELLEIKTRSNMPFREAVNYCNAIGKRNPNGRPWTLSRFHCWIKAAEAGFPLPNGSHKAAPIPANATSVPTIDDDD